MRTKKEESESLIRVVQYYQRGNAGCILSSLPSEKKLDIFLQYILFLIAFPF